MSFGFLALRCDVTVAGGSVFGPLPRDASMDSACSTDGRVDAHGEPLRFTDEFVIERELMPKSVLEGRKFILHLCPFNVATACGDHELDRLEGAAT